MKYFKCVIIAIIATLLCISGCSKDNLSEITTPTTLRKVINSISISPTSITVTKGQTFLFTAIVDAVGQTAQTVTWTVEGGLSETSISTSGLLTININETTTTLTVIVTSAIDATVYATATVNVVDPLSTVTSVEITPETVSITKGETQQFTAVVIGDYNPSPAVTWSVEGGVLGTIIDNSGILTVSIAEIAETLAVVATSVQDATFSGTATVTVTEPYTPPLVTDVMVTPATATIIRGETQQFSAVVIGENTPPQDVSWSVDTATTGTTIDSNGLLTVDITELANTLTVTATSDFDQNISGTATITVADQPSTVSSVIITPDTAIVGIGTTQMFTAVVHGDYNPPQDVTWTMSGNLSNSTNIHFTSGLLTVAIDETATELTITATSAYDQNYNSNASVSVPQISTIAVTPATPVLDRGSILLFNVSVSGTDGISQNVLWSLQDNYSSSTIITQTGQLTVGNDETAISLTVTATSTYDPSKYGVVTVSLRQVTSVTVTPPAPIVSIGLAYQFSANVIGENVPPQNITWDVAGGEAGTTIDTDGLLTISGTETATALTIIATSVYNTDISGSATVDVAQVIDIVVSPDAQRVLRGDTQHYLSTVSEVNGAPWTVSWSVTGGSSVETVITASGDLSVADDETATVLTVTATSTYNIAISGSTTVRVPQVTGVVLTPSFVNLFRGQSQQYTVEVQGNDDPPQEVDWLVTDGNAFDTFFDRDTRTLTIGQNEIIALFGVRATSRYAFWHAEDAEVHLLYISWMNIDADDNRVARGQSLQLTIEVIASIYTSHEVIWTVEGASAGTTISDSGLLTVASDEPANNITVRARSVDVPNHTATFAVTVTGP